MAVRGMCELRHTSAMSKKCKGQKTPRNWRSFGSGALSFIANRSSFLIGELLLSKLSETIVVVGNAAHDRPGFLVSHLIGNRASFLCTKAPMLRIPETNFLHGITSISGRDVQAI
jgi:hypothetical protein